MKTTGLTPEEIYRGLMILFDSRQNPSRIVELYAQEPEEEIIKAIQERNGTLLERMPAGTLTSLGSGQKVLYGSTTSRTESGVYLTNYEIHGADTKSCLLTLLVQAQKADNITSQTKLHDFRRRTQIDPESALRPFTALA